MRRKHTENLKILNGVRFSHRVVSNCKIFSTNKYSYKQFMMTYLGITFYPQFFTGDRAERRGYTNAHDG